MHITRILLKIIHFAVFWTVQTLPFFISFQKNFFSPQKLFMSCLCLRQDAYWNGTCNVFACLLTIFSWHDWFGFFLNKWGYIRFALYWNITPVTPEKTSRTYTIYLVKLNSKFRNLPITTFWRYEFEYVYIYIYICQLVGTWGAQL